MRRNAGCNDEDGVEAPSLPLPRFQTFPPSPPRPKGGSEEEPTPSGPRRVRRPVRWTRARDVAAERKGSDLTAERERVAAKRRGLADKPRPQVAAAEDVSMRASVLPPGYQWVVGRRGRSTNKMKQRTDGGGFIGSCVCCRFISVLCVARKRKGRTARHGIALHAAVPRERVGYTGHPHSSDPFMSNHPLTPTNLSHS